MKPIRKIIMGAALGLVVVNSQAVEPPKTTTLRQPLAGSATANGEYSIKEAWDTPSTGANGWNALGKTQQTYHSSGGHPGGYLALWSSITPAQTSRRSPELTGNFIQKGVNGFQVDLRTTWTSTSSVKPKAPAIHIRGNASKDAWVLPLNDFSFRSEQWQTVNVSFDPRWTDQQAIANGWEAPRANYYISFADAMKSVLYLAIYVNASKSTHPMHVDNFIIKGKQGGYSSGDAIQKPAIRATPLINSAPSRITPSRTAP